MAVGFVASATSGSQASVASFNIGTLGTGARAGIVFVCTHNSATDIVTGVTWNGVSMNLLFKATDTDTEPGVVEAYFLDNVTNGTITVSRTNNATVTVGYAASISAAANRGLEVAQTITRVSSTQNTDADTSTTGTGASGEVSVDDGSLSGTDSMRFAAAYSGAATPPLQGTNSTNLQVLDSTALGSRFVRETTAGQGSRSVGFATGTTDDWALVAVAVRETTKQVSAGHASGTGSSFGASADVQPNSGHASGTGSAFNATIQTGKDVSAGHASGSGQAFNATTTIDSAPNVATGTGAANQVSAEVAPNTGHASGTGAAFNATVQTTSGTNVDAGHASGTGQAFNASAAIDSAPNIATGTGSAFGAAASIATSAGGAAGSGTAGGPSPSIATGAGNAAGTGQAFNATVSTSGGTNANAGHASGTGLAFGASIAIAAGIQNASGTGQAFNATISTVGLSDAGKAGKATPRRAMKVAPLPIPVAVEFDVTAIVPTPTVDIYAEVNDDEVVLELLADLL